MQYFGGFQRFINGPLTLTLNRVDHFFTAGIGDRNLERIGYDRYALPDQSVKPFYSQVGVSHLEGPSYPAPHVFSWSFQLLPDAEYQLLTAIIERSHSTKTPIRLQDGLLSYCEAAPRTRAKVGTYLESAHGAVWYFPIFDVWCDRPIEQTLTNGKHYLRMAGTEWNPRSPVPTSADVA